MDVSESTRIVFNRIKKLEPENVTKIIGYLLLQDHADQEMDNLAMSPEVVLQEVVSKAKAQICQFQLTSKLPSSSISPSISPNRAPLFAPFSSRPILSPPTFRVPSSYWEPQVVSKHQMGFQESVPEVPNQTQFLNLEDQVDPVNLASMGFVSDQLYSDCGFGNFGPRGGKRFGSFNEFPVKSCHYFNKGFCKHGSNCRYFHGLGAERFPQMFDVVNEDHQVFLPGTLEKLEMEIIELLKSRKGHPVSIASLPMIYYEKYGKVLQAEGYLTESQRHGKAGYSLTKLLARLKNSIRVIDRPHGQHAVILAEDAHKYLENRGDKNDPGPIVSGSRQIYLTFPAESTFSEEDVSNYFSTFGPVEDVRLPCLQKRMFGFVTFETADTVRMILAKGNPHFVCGARVLVKPYREKTKLMERKYQERIEPMLHYSPHYLEMEDELQSLTRGYETSRLLRRRLIEEQERALQIELQTRRKHISDESYFGYSLDRLNVSEDNYDLPSAECFSNLLDVLSIGSASDEKIRHTENNYNTDLDSQGLNLPESPFATAVGSSISTVT